MASLFMLINSQTDNPKAAFRNILLGKNSLPESINPVRNKYLPGKSQILLLWDELMTLAETVETLVPSR
ncbi:hypothetical protein [Epilithonimonas sp.]|uniref:hypothetical protein n=1 Tax=Epilithonimonas sp. TaxID=2894511 RepID=UPI00289A80D0|nr:hypothetical protein [Epilithonimonas sp.]